MNTNRALEATPIVVDGRMFFTTSGAECIRLMQEQVRPFGPMIRWSQENGVVVRAAMSSIEASRSTTVAFMWNVDGRLLALDAESGKLDWEVDTLIDRDRFYTITGAPRVANGKVFIGNAARSSASEAMSRRMIRRRVTRCGVFTLFPAIPVSHLSILKWS